jgi:VanZ family protein
MRKKRIKAELQRIVDRRKTLVRPAAWACVAVITFMSLAPADTIARHGGYTDLGSQVEHTIAYGGTALLVAIAYGERGLVSILLALLAYAGAMEFLQHYSPGRTPGLGDFAFSAAGVLLGIAASMLLEAWLRTRP